MSVSHLVSRAGCVIRLFRFLIVAFSSTLPFSVGRDLPKFPKVVRLDIAKEIGYSKMNKISAEKRNKLLKFALKNMVEKKLFLLSLR